MKTIFLDTNIFLHYEPFDQIKWLEIVQAESATILIPPVTIRELNKHKDYHSQPRVRNRAGEVLKRLLALFESPAGTSLRDNINIVFEDRDPVIDFAAHQLSPDIQDDHLIASILMYQNEAAGTETVLVTSDAVSRSWQKQGDTELQQPECQTTYDFRSNQTHLRKESSNSKKRYVT